MCDDEGKIAEHASKELVGRGANRGRICQAKDNRLAGRTNINRFNVDVDAMGTGKFQTRSSGSDIKHFQRCCQGNDSQFWQKVFLRTDCVVLPNTDEP